MGVKIIGRERLNRKFKAMPKAVEAQLKKALERSANEIVRDMKRLVPQRTGKLRDSIAWTWGHAPDGSVVILKGRAPTGENDLFITIYAGIRGAGNYDQGFYVRFVEFGTRKMAAQPFFFPAYRSNRQRASSRIRNGIRRAVKDVMAGKLSIGDE